MLVQYKSCATIKASLRTWKLLLSVQGSQELAIPWSLQTVAVSKQLACTACNESTPHLYMSGLLS